MLTIEKFLGVCVVVLLAACSATETRLDDDGFAFEGTCVNCHAGLTSGHVHANYKLRCVDCHGGNDAVAVDAEASKTEAKFRDPTVIAQAHVRPKPGLARFFFANGLDDDNDGRIDEGPTIVGNLVQDFGEVFEPQLHGEGAGEFLDTELSRDLNYARFLNPGDLRVATIGCGGANRVAGESNGCHQQSIEVVRRSIMVNQSAVINGAYYGNESWRSDFITARGNEPDPRQGAFGYTLDYVGVDACITPAPANDATGRAQPTFDSRCLEQRATTQDPAVRANAPGNAGLPAWEIAQGNLEPVLTGDQTIEHFGAGHTRFPWGGTIREGDVVDVMRPVPNGNLAPGIPDPVDVILRTFRAYYPLNYPGSTTNFNFTFGTSILPEIARFKTASPYGRGHSSGCSACHAPYNYEGNRVAQKLRQDDGSITEVVDPTTKHREFNPAQDRATIAGRERLVGRVVTAQERLDTGRAQQKTYSANHAMTTKIDTDTCGLCHGFVTRINLAYQGMAEEEQRDALARRKPIEFTTPAGTPVRIVDSWVREDNISGQPVIVTPEGVQVIEKAKQRDAELARQGLLAGAGGCAQAVFSEDCNNNGELDRGLVLTRVDESGATIASAVIDEDQNGNGKLDLLDRIPREKAIDGRQMRYVYGGKNGSTRQMDVHFERGMHCIDCHFLQDVHGDGHIYSTNWDAIEIECEDCHGTGTARATLVTSGPNGGNDLTTAKNDDLQPFFERQGTTIIQRSRVTPGIFWRVPQTVDFQSAYARQAHDGRHVPGIGPDGRGLGSTFAGTQGSSKLTSGKLECQSCHGSWIHNCMGCHVDLNLGDPQRKFVDAAGNITQSAGENEVWFSNANNPGHVNFQLLGMLRSPFMLGVSSTAEKGRLSTFRSSMIVQLNVTGADGHTAIDNATFTTFQAVDANSGRMNVATSGAALNQTMPHTVRPAEARGCETCHPLVDTQGRVRNEHVLAMTYGLGTGAYPYLGDWAIAAGAGGIELFEHKQEKELAANVAGTSNRFPGLIVNPNGRTPAAVEPILDGALAGGVGVDVALIRNFNAAPAMPGGTRPPTLRDLAVVAVDVAGAGRLVISDITARGHPASVRQSVNTGARNTIVTLAGAPRGLAHLAPDVSDPFVYVAVGAAGVAVVEIKDAPGVAGAAVVRATLPLQSGETATDVVLAGDVLYVGTQQGTVQTFSLTNPALPAFESRVVVGAVVNELAVVGFQLYAATQSGVAVLGLDDPNSPNAPRGTSGIAFAGGVPAQGLAVSEGKVYVAAGVQGVFELDMRTPGEVGIKNLSATLAPGQPVNAVDVVVSALPGQTWVLALDATGDLWGLKLDGRQSIKERCFPNPRASKCLLDVQFMDPTLMSRDPSFDPVANTFDSAAVDPSAVTFFRQTRGVIASGRRLAEPGHWDQMGTLTGRRVRDSFMPGSGVLSLEVMQRMRGYAVCERVGTPSNNPSGLDELGEFAGAACNPFTVPSARAHAATAR